MKKNYEKRLERLESRPAQQWSDVCCWVCQGRFYDELDEEQRARYCAYRGVDRTALEEVEHAVSGTLHFKLERKPEPPTPSKLREIADYIEETFFKRKE